MIATPEQLRALFPRAKIGYLAALSDDALLAAHDLQEPICFCMFLAQAAEETGEFTIVEESGNFSAERLIEVWPNRFTPAQATAYAHKPQAILSRAYARKELGNGSEASGDGWKYRGRGPFQTTGKDNYRRSGDRLGVDLVANPDLLASDFTLGWKAAMLEWSALDLGRIARELGPTHEAVLKISRGINCGDINSSIVPNGFAERKAAFAKIWSALGTSDVPKLDPTADGILEEGERGDAVKALQQALIGLGYAVGEPDGVFGPRTTAAVAALQTREKLGGELGKYRVEWAPQLAGARPFDDAGRQTVTAPQLAAKGDSVVALLMWFRRAMVAIATYLGLDTAADQAGLQLPSNIVALKQTIDPLAMTLQWLAASKWVFGIALCIGAGWLATRGIGELVERYRKPAKPLGAP